MRGGKKDLRVGLLFFNLPSNNGGGWAFSVSLAVGLEEGFSFLSSTLTLARASSNMDKAGNYSICKRKCGKREKVGEDWRRESFVSK